MTAIVPLVAPAGLAGLARIDSRGGTLLLSRAWPQRDGGVHLEYTDAAGARVAAQLLSDSADGDEAVRATRGRVELHPGVLPVVIHWAGVDNRLRALAGLVRDGAVVLGHRPGRRAVVRRPDRTYAKVMRPGRSTELVAAGERARAAAEGRFDVPRLLGHDVDDGVVTWAELAGPTLFQLGRLAGREPDLARAWESAGRALAALHAHDPRGLAGHDAGAEVAAAKRWADAAVAYGLLPTAPDPTAYGMLLAGPPGPLGTLHRDFHDKQVVVGQRPGLLDLDTLAVGERALDLGNVLVHLELRAEQGLLGRAAAETARRAFLDGAAPDDATLRRIPGHVRVARVRLAGVYAFRPRWNTLARRWWERETGTAPR